MGCVTMDRSATTLRALVSLSMGRGELCTSHGGQADGAVPAAGITRVPEAGITGQEPCAPGVLVRGCRRAREGRHRVLASPALFQLFGSSEQPCEPGRRTVPFYH